MGGREQSRPTRRAFLTGLAGASAALSGCLVRGEDRQGLRGEIVVDGSDTVLPFTAAVAETFQWRNNRVRIPVRGSGTGAGFRRFCAGETDLQDASRPIMDDEATRCGENGVEPVELPLLRDGLAVWVHPDNDWCDCLTMEELGRLWESGSDVDTWSDLREGWPDEPVELYGRDSASGTFDYFTHAVTGEAGNVRSDYAASSDTNVVVRGVRGDRYALGFGGAGYYYENEDDLRLVAVDDGEGCARPTRESVESDSYALARPMFVYVDAPALRREAVRAFCRFFFGEAEVETDGSPAWAQWAAREVGYYAMSDATLEESERRLENAIEEWT